MSHVPPGRVTAAVLLALVAAVLAACSRTEADPRLEAPLVRTEIASPASSADRTFTGIVSARVQSNLGFRVAGKVTDRLVDAGQTVKAGQPLMRIDRTDLALANAAATQAVEAARALALQTAADEARFRGLVSRGAVSASSYDQARAASESAAARLRAAEADARVSNNAAGYSTLIADADGTVVDTLVEPGQVVTAGQVVVRLAHAGPREAVVDLPETVRPAIGSEATAVVFGGTAPGARATLRQLSDSADPSTRTFEARYVLEGDASRAPLGATVAVHIPRPGDHAIQVPIAAIYDAGKGPGVWIVSGKSPAVSWKTVTLAKVSDESAFVSSGLAPGQRYVALGAHALHEGERVRLSAQVAPVTAAAPASDVSSAVKAGSATVGATP
ncbi:MAG: efflux RND transporter periplasmic adaptor subunit [Luteibacter sp.]